MNDDLIYTPELLARLRDVNNVTSNDVYELLLKQAELFEPAMRPSDFFQGEGDLQEYRAAVTWWNAQGKLPDALQCPTLYQLTYRYFEGVGFLDRLHERAKAVVTYKQSTRKGRPPKLPEVPGESKQERTARLNRERVAKHRLQTKAAWSPAMLEAWNVYQTALADVQKATQRAQKAHAEFKRLKGEQG